MVLNIPSGLLKLFCCGSQRDTQDCLIYAKLIMPYSEVIHGSTTFELTKGKQKLKKIKTIHIDVLDLPSFSSLQCP